MQNLTVLLPYFYHTEEIMTAVDAENTQPQERQSRFFSVLYNLTKIINSAPANASFAERLAQEVVFLLQCKSCSLMFLDDTRQNLLSEAHAGLQEQELAWIHNSATNGIIAWVAQHGAPLKIGDIHSDSRFAQAGSEMSFARSLLCIPLIVGASVIGVITVTSDKEQYFSKHDEDILGFVGNTIIQDLNNANQFRLSTTDEETKAFNRQYLFIQLPHELERARRFGNPLSVMLFDIDNYRDVIAHNGSQAGSYILRQLVTIIKTKIRDIDTLVRYAEDEFLIVLPHTDLKGASHIAERIRCDVEEQIFFWSDSQLRITISAGLASLGARVTTEIELIEVAEDNLLKAKLAGKNRIIK